MVRPKYEKHYKKHKDLMDYDKDKTGQMAKRVPKDSRK